MSDYHVERIQRILTHIGESSRRRRRRVGFVGFGKVGRFLFEKVRDHEDLEVAFVCDLFAPDAVRAAKDVPERCKVYDPKDIPMTKPDLICEVAHPNVTKKYGEFFLSICDYMMASTTAFADSDCSRKMMREAQRKTGNGLYLTTGALWAANDIKKMSDQGVLSELCITMKKHPRSLKLKGGAKKKLDAAEGQKGEIILYDGPLRELCFEAPNNVNTMATAGIAALNTTGFDRTRVRLISDQSLQSTIIIVDALGTPTTPSGDALYVFFFLSFDFYVLSPLTHFQHGQTVVSCLTV
jgi:aspartate dehydrogenase